tara:strand:+ start:2262 stop:3818 length:1557 start_codon:yes stop_codon:yes gene_type:complete
LGNSKDMRIKSALISVSNKEKLNEILKELKKYNIKLISSGGTYKKIKSLGYKCVKISDFTSFPEILDGRVKTLHPKIHSGILYKREKKSHKKIIKKLNFESIDLVIANFYPFEKIIKQNKNHKIIIENIDIGGPTLVRAAAKNYKDVVVITKIEHYQKLADELNFFKGRTSLQFREKMSQEAFFETASYDSTIFSYFSNFSKQKIPEKLFIKANLIDKLRYGENPHQLGAIYGNEEEYKIKKLHGKKLSYNNYNDIFASLSLAKTLPKNKGTVIVKHTNPSGVSIENDHLESYFSAMNCDPVSAFGGIVTCNYKLSLRIAKEIIKNYYEVIIANGFDKQAIKLFKNKKNLRLIDSTRVQPEKYNKIVSQMNSFLMQTNDSEIFNKNNFKVVSKIKPSKKLMEQLLFSFNVCRSVKSNAIVISQNNKTLGIGSGQPSRLDSCKIAIEKMKKFKQFNNKNPIVAASDAFFPFVDGIESLVQSGITAIIQPHGSIKDKEIIKFANDMGIVLIFSKSRHFRH